MPSRAAASDSSVGVGVEDPVLLVVLPPRVRLVTRLSITYTTGELYYEYQYAQQYITVFQQNLNVFMVISSDSSK